MRASSDARLLDIYAATERYYSRKAIVYGPTPTGVDWPSAETQELRIAQLLKSLNFERPCSLNDLGCGYGASLSLISKSLPAAQIDYLGIDLSSEMIRLAQLMWCGRVGASFIVGNVSPRVADYSIASGIFNVKLECTRERWEELIRQTLRDLSGASRRGFAVNFLDAAGAQDEVPELYRTQPEPWVKYCEAECDSQVNVISGYGLPEFCLRISKR
jgi:SAM-dependent methyltransferase